MVNPAYATRQLHEDFASRYGIKGHLTALQLKNPNNAPDPWETQALRRLQAGEKIVVEKIIEDGGEAVRLMRPVYMEPGCQKCHADMNIPLGGLRGGITTLIPLKPFMSQEAEVVQNGLITHGAIWLVGLVGIGWNHRRNRERHNERNKALLLAMKEDRRIAEILSMSERLEKMTEREIIQQGLETAVRLTESQIGYFHFINDDQNSIELVTWSKATLDDFCKAAYDNHYPIEQAGIWADCARLRQPVIHNDYANAPIKRGLPEGHAALHRHMSVPVLESNLVRIITGVGNKAAPYDEHDTRLLQLLANDIWKLIQRKRADTELRESEQRLREAQQMAQIGNWTLDHATGKYHWSDQMYAIFGVDRNIFKPAADSISDLIHPDDRRASEAAFALTLAEKREFDRILRIVQPGGQSRTLHFRAKHQYQPDQQPLRSIGTAQDVTEQREVEKLRQSKADLTALFEHTDRIIWSIDEDCRLVLGNSLFFQTLKESIGRTITTGEPLPMAEVGAETEAQWREYYRRALAGEKFSANVEVSTVENGSRWIDFTFFPIIDEDTANITGVTITGRDYTARRELEESQKQTLEQMATMVRELESHHQLSLRINRLNDLLQSCRTEAEAYEVITLSLAEIFPASSGCLAVVTSHDRELRRVSSWGTTPGSNLETFALDDCWALRRGEMHQSGLVAGELNCKHFDPLPAHGYLCLPLVVRGETLALLNLEHPAEASPETLRHLRETAHAVAETIKLSLSNLRLRVALEERATHDALTGLFNRRYLDETLPRELHRNQRTKGKLTVAMLDIDHFKKFNDQLGHEAGDLVLRHIGELLQANLRKSDIGCRYGGEELLVILPESSAEDAHEHLADICDKIRHMRVNYRGGLLPPVTVSVGIACTSSSLFDVAHLLRAADEALYAAKQAGRDRIVIHTEKPGE
jgi:diguanylate cyclase (GGDEF)-like protein/PAS domain S-box-containing protein